MRKLLILLLVISTRTFAAGPISYVESYRDTYFDDTATLQAHLTAGDYTAPANTTYHTSGPLTVTHKFHMNGSTIIGAQTFNAMVILSGTFSQIDGGTLNGGWDFTTAANPSGTYGVKIQNNNQVVLNMNITQMPGYGINCLATSYISVTYTKITKIGYIGFFFDPENNTTANNTFSHNTVDRSMINPATVQQLAVGIRGSTNTAGDTTSNWTIAYDTLKMPLRPSSSAAECLEVRMMKNSTISNLICLQGSIGISAVRCTNVVVSHNRTTNSGMYGIEFADTHYSKTGYNSVNGSVHNGILVDGAPASSADSLLYDTVKNTTQSAIQLYTGTHNVVISGAVVTHASQGIYCQATDSIIVYHTSIDGGSRPSTTGIYLNGGTGNISISRGGILHNSYAVYSTNSGVNQLVDYVIGTSVNLTGTINQFGSSFSNGARYGVNVYFTSGTLVFGTISSHIYGDTDFSPGATSGLPITYTSANTSIATIVSGNIHITGTGSVNITASNGDTSAVRSVAITKAILTITANNKTKVYGAVNPSLSARFSGFKYGQTNSVLTTQPALTTTAVTLSPPANYPITASGAASANYSFTYVQGILTISSSGGTGEHGIRLRARIK